ncbi:hypothetical protein NBRC10512_005667 [Rhodotorula toruloides]|uniref:RHTO0S15e00232g1_1 n=2 Tax=Rhodotorula toruloides TaxID=5286 RepID=A0A061BCF2_RHOTO|nr:uncharacterized protein RHTO_03295 [Rhodotorula toruloides NP11]EMS25566.1 hypothetical protein RHTO_03295 [Rhodotorula toruloides NP11]CDR47655.1 RHTO0S15e00232g1_1 [Rhodotorula toruloides]
MDAPLATSGDAADQPTDGRTQREGSYHPMASDTDSGAISDGDPPGYSGGTPPPPLLAPPPALPGQQQDHSETASASGSVAGGSASGTPTTNGTGTGKSKTAFKRAFEELEDIVFSNPKSFVTMASTIAESRGVQVLISDDRTHKVSSAYMHMICVYRKSGCPFILKLTKSKEGGWITKSARAIEIDPKQRSVYRCRHVATAHPDYRLGITPADWIAMARPDGTSGQFVPSAKAKSKTRVSLGGIKYEDGEASSSPAPIKPPGRMATRNKPASSTPASPSGAGRTGTGGGMDVDRALAPPFQRAIDLQAQIAPALAPPAGAITGVPPPAGRPGASPSTSNALYSRNATASPRHPAASTSGPSRGLVLPLYDTAPSASVAPQYSNPPSSALAYPRAGGSSGVSPIPRHAALHPASPSIPVAATPPCVAAADPSALPDWTALLTALDDPELLPLARVLASPAIAATPTSFFADEIDDELRDKLLESLPAQATGLWPKLKLARRMKERGRECWARIVEERGGAKGGKNKRPAANGDADEATRKRKRSASPAVTAAEASPPAPAPGTNGIDSSTPVLALAATPFASADRAAKLSLSPPAAADATHASPLSLTPSLPPMSTLALAASPTKEPNGAVTMRMAWSPSAGHIQEVVAPAPAEAPKSAVV